MVWHAPCVKLGEQEKSTSRRKLTCDDTNEIASTSRHKFQVTSFAIIV